MYIGPLCTGQWGPGLLVDLVGGLCSPSHLSVVGHLQGFIRVVVPPTILLHSGREAAVGPRLLIRLEIHAYFSAIYRSFHYPPPVDALGCSCSSAPPRMHYRLHEDISTVLLFNQMQKNMQAAEH